MTEPAFSSSSFIIEQGGAVVADFNLVPGKPVLLGRSPQADVQISDPGMSRVHCKVELTPQGILITDMGSSNGTFVNGERIRQALVGSGDVIVVGTTSIRMTGAPGGGVGVQVAPGPMAAPGGEPMTECVSCGGLFPLSTLQQKELDMGKTGFECPNCLAKRRQQATAGIEGYQILGKLGEGAMGTVYKAIREKTGEVCVVKVMKTQGDMTDVRYFIREASAVAKLKHPNIVQIMEFGDARGRPFLSMEFVDGGTLGDRLKKGPLTARQVVGIAGQIVQALDHAAQVNIVHRDIKPENIFLTRQGRAKLGDFGLAKDISQAGQSGLTRPGEGRGTPLYMPPEQLDNAVAADARSDLYALGATMFHALAGRPPFLASSLRQIISAIINQEPPTFKELGIDCPATLEQCIRKLLNKSPDDRYQTPKDVLNVLTQVWKDLPTK